MKLHASRAAGHSGGVVPAHSLEKVQANARAVLRRDGRVGRADLQRGQTARGGALRLPGLVDLHKIACEPTCICTLGYTLHLGDVLSKMFLADLEIHLLGILPKKRPIVSGIPCGEIFVYAKSFLQRIRKQVAVLKPTLARASRA